MLTYNEFLSVTISKWIMLQCLFHFIFKSCYDIGKTPPNNELLIFTCIDLFLWQTFGILPQKKKKKSEKKNCKKTCCFQFSVSILFSARIHHFCKTHKRKIKQNATMVIHISKFPHYYNFHGLNHC